MGKIFGLMACLVTAAVTTGCVKASDATAEIEKFKADLDRQEIEREQTFERIKETTRELVKRNGNASCRKKEEDQKISEELAAAAINVELNADEQKTVYINCDGKEQDVGPIKYITQGSTVIPGLQVADVVTSVEVESVRTCAKLDTDKIVADVTQQPESILLLLESDGDTRIPLSNSNLEGITVAEGKNLWKLKYYNCAQTAEVKNDDGTFTKTCAKNDLIGEKQVVVNVTLNTKHVDEIRKVDLCKKKKEEKPAEKPTTDGQE